MNYIISESQKNTVSTNFIKVLKNKDMYDTLGMFKLPPQFLDKILGKKVLNVLECVDYYYLYFYYYGRKNFVKRSYEDEFYKIETEDAGMVTFFAIIEKSTNNKIEGYATPYYEGECHLPVDVEYFTPNSDELNEISLFLGYESVNIPKKFDSFSNMFEFFNVEYFKLLINKLIPLFNEYREEDED